MLGVEAETKIVETGVAGGGQTNAAGVQDAEAPRLGQSPYVIVTFDFPFTVLEVSPSWSEMTGFKEKAIRNRSLRMLQGPDTDFEVIKAIVLAAKQGRSDTCLVTLYLASGDQFNCVATSNSTKCGDKDACMLIMTFSDAIAMKIENVMDAENAEVVVSVSSWVITVVNLKFCELFGYLESQLVGRGIQLIHCPETDANEWHKMVQFSKNGIACSTFLKLADGKCTTFDCEVASFPIVANSPGKGVDRICFTFLPDDGKHDVNHSKLHRVGSRDGIRKSNSKSASFDSKFSNDSEGETKEHDFLGDSMQSCWPGRQTGSLDDDIIDAGGRPMTASSADNDPAQKEFMEMLSRLPAQVLSRSTPGWIGSPNRCVEKMRSDVKDARMTGKLTKISAEVLLAQSEATVSVNRAASALHLPKSHSPMCSPNSSFDKSQSIMDKSDRNRTIMKMDKATMRHLQAMQARRSSNSSAQSSVDSCSSQTSRNDLSEMALSGGYKYSLGQSLDTAESRMAEPRSPKTLNQKVAAIMRDESLSGRERFERVQAARKEDADAKAANELDDDFDVKADVFQGSQGHTIPSVAEEGNCTPLSVVLGLRRAPKLAGAKSAEVVETSSVEALSSKESEALSSKESSIDIGSPLRGVGDVAGPAVRGTEHGGKVGSGVAKGSFDSLTSSTTEDVRDHVARWKGPDNSGSWGSKKSFNDFMFQMLSEGAEVEGSNAQCPLSTASDESGMPDSITRALSVGREQKQRELDHVEAAIVRLGGDRSLILEIAMQFVGKLMPDNMAELQDNLVYGNMEGVAKCAQSMIDNAECIGAISLIDFLTPFAHMDKAHSGVEGHPSHEVVRSVGLARVELERLTRFWRNFDVTQA